MLYDMTRRIKACMEFTAVFRKVPEGYIAFVEEVPGANTQARAWTKLGETSKSHSPWDSKAIENWLMNH